MHSCHFHLIYLHGFNSSPQSKKALQIQQHFEDLGMADCIEIPALANEPARAIEDLQALVTHPRRAPVVLAGSSLGGFYATWLAEEFGLRAVLINPAVRPYERWEPHLGLNRNYYTGETYTVTREHVRQLQALEKSDLTLPERYLLLVQTGDEVLDYRDAVDKYRDSPRIIQQGGDHSFQDFPAVLPDIMEFLAAASPSKQTPSGKGTE